MSEPSSHHHSVDTSVMSRKSTGVHCKCCNDQIHIKTVVALLTCEPWEYLLNNMKCHREVSYDAEVCTSGLACITI